MLDLRLGYFEVFVAVINVGVLYLFFYFEVLIREKLKNMGENCFLV
jgi:hypothetical protein